MRNVILLAALSAGLIAGFLFKMQITGRYRLPSNVVSDQTFSVLKKPDYAAQLTINLHQYQGKIIVVNFWASWCAPCITEFPMLLEVANKYPDRVIFIAVSADQDIDKMRTFLETLDQERLSLMNVRIAHDPDMDFAISAFNVSGLPETVIIDDTLQVRHKIQGTDWTVGSMSAMIDHML